MSKANVGWVERLVRRSSKSEGGSVLRRLRLFIGGLRYANPPDGLTWCGMFGFRRRKATAAATQAALFIVTTFEKDIGGPLPDRFWLDPYALGYLYWIISIFAKLATNQKVSGEDLVRCLGDSFAAISGRNGMALARLAIELLAKQQSDFIEGISNAEKLIAVIYGSRNYDHDPDVITATKMADAVGTSLDFLGSTNRSTTIASCLGLLIFHNRIKQRLGIASE